MLASVQPPTCCSYLTGGSWMVRTEPGWNPASGVLIEPRGQDWTLVCTLAMMKDTFTMVSLLLTIVCGPSQAAAALLPAMATGIASCATQNATLCPRNGMGYYLCKSGRAILGCRPAIQGPFPATSCTMQCTTRSTLPSPPPSKTLSRPSPPFPSPRLLSPFTAHSSPPSPLPPSPPPAPNGPGRRLRWSDEFTPGSSINQVSGYSTGTGCNIRHWAASDHQSIFTYFNLPVPVL